MKITLIQHNRIDIMVHMQGSLGPDIWGVLILFLMKINYFSRAMIFLHPVFWKTILRIAGKKGNIFPDNILSNRPPRFWKLLGKCQLGWFPSYFIFYPLFIMGCTPTPQQCCSHCHVNHKISNSRDDGWDQWFPAWAILPIDGWSVHTGCNKNSGAIEQWPKNINASMYLIWEDYVRPEFCRQNQSWENSSTFFLCPCSLAGKMFGYNPEGFLKGAIEQTETTTVCDDREKSWEPLM